MEDETLKQRNYVFRKILYELSKQITPEELENCYENLEPKQWGYAYRDMGSDYDMEISVSVEFIKIKKDERLEELLKAEKKGETTYLNLEKEFGGG